MGIESSNPHGDRLVRGDIQGDYDNPNAGISEDLKSTAAVRVLFFLWYFRVDTFFFRDGDGAESDCFLVKTGNRDYLIYIRVTLEDEQEEGAGPMPGILIDLAQELNAQPRVLRVHLRRVGDKVQEELFGQEALEQEWKAAAWWRRTLLRGRTARDCLRLVGGRPSKLELLIQQLPPRTRSPRPWESPFAAECGTAQEPPNYSAGSLELTLQVQPPPHTHLRGQIRFEHLLASTQRSDRFRLFACNCSSPECDCLTRPVEVITEDGLVVWRLLGSRPRRLLVFDHRQYREEILTKVRRALALHREMRFGTILGPYEQLPLVNRALFLAEESIV